MHLSVSYIQTGLDTRYRSGGRGGGGGGGALAVKLEDTVNAKRLYLAEVRKVRLGLKGEGMMHHNGCKGDKEGVDHVQCRLK